MWEEAYKADLEYQSVNGGKHKDDIAIGNYTGYKPSTPPSLPAAPPPKPQSQNSKPQSNPAPQSPPLNRGSTIRVKPSATHFASGSGNLPMAGFVPGGTYSVYEVNGNEVLIGRNGAYTGRVKPSATHFASGSGNLPMAGFVPGGTYSVYEVNGNEVLIGRNGAYTGWIRKSDIVGYASGTVNAASGLHRIDEVGPEYIFESKRDGSKFRMFGGGEKVLNAKATSFLYDFATSGGGIMSKMIHQIMHSVSNIGGIGRGSVVEINAGDIIVNGNATNHTVSEIRRAQRENLEYVIKEFNKLNKCRGSVVEINAGDIIVNGNATNHTVSEIRRAQRENLEYVIKEFNKLNK